MAIRHAVSLRGEAEAISPRFLALLGMTIPIAVLGHENLIDSGIANIYTDHLETPQRIAAELGAEIEIALAPALEDVRMACRDGTLSGDRFGDDLEDLE